MSVRNLIRRSGVTLICTTDDPADSLYWHKELAADDSFEVQVLPAWRPDKAMNIEKPDYAEYLKKLGQAARCQIEMFADLKMALKKRMSCQRSCVGICDVCAGNRRKSGKDLCKTQTG